MWQMATLLDGMDARTWPHCRKFYNFINAWFRYY